MICEPINKRIILALDVSTIDEAKNIVNKLKDKIKFYKVGLQLFLVGGTDFLKWLKDKDADIMLDLKFFDIPRTIDAAINQVQEYVRYLTVHSQCNILDKIDEKYRNKILGVSVLTCFNDIDVQDDCGIHDYHYNVSVDKFVRRRVIQAYKTGCAGAVLSGLELETIRETLTFQRRVWDIYNPDFVLITPGIQLTEQRNDDQKRVVTIEEAFNSGADYVVIGRPILKSDDMIKTIELAQEQISKCGIKFGVAQVPAVVHHLDETTTLIDYKYDKGEKVK